MSPVGRTFRRKWMRPSVMGNRPFGIKRCNSAAHFRGGLAVQRRWAIDRVIPARKQGRLGVDLRPIYGDNLIRCDLGRLRAFHLEHGGAATIALHYREDVTHSGVVALDEQDQVTRFVEKPRAGEVPSHWVNAGILVLDPVVLDVIPPGIPSDFGRNILPRLLEQGERLYGYRFDATEGIWWIDTPGDFARAQHTFKGAVCQ